jgi:ribosome-associated protein
MEGDALVRAAVNALEDIKARDIVVLDVRRLTSLFDTVIVASGDSARQTKALARHVQDVARSCGVSVSGVEGEDSGEWVLVDLGDVVVHVMQPAVRSYYNLEELWGGPRAAPTGSGAASSSGSRSASSAGSVR